MPVHDPLGSARMDTRAAASLLFRGSAADQKGASAIQKRSTSDASKAKAIRSQSPRPGSELQRQQSSKKYDGALQRSVVVSNPLGPLG